MGFACAGPGLAYKADLSKIRAPVTGFVLAQRTHQTGYQLAEYLHTRPCTMAPPGADDVTTTCAEVTAAPPSCRV